MYHYLFDTNVYRCLVQSEDGVAFERLAHSLGSIPILDEISRNEHAYTISPFTFLEGIGRQLPKFEFDIPKDLVKDATIPELVDHIYKAGFSLYNNCESLTRSSLMARALEQTGFNEKNHLVTEFEKHCIYDPLQYTNFESHVHETLAFDFLCKQPYPKRIVLPLLNYLMITNLYSNPLTPFSKFRLLALHWRSIEDQYKKENLFNPQTIISFSKSLKLKTTRDTLDCELIHLVCLGKYSLGEFQPVLAFTSENKQNITDRILAYRSLNNVFATSHDVDIIKGLGRTPICHMWKHGVVAFCNEDGSIYDYLVVAELPLY